MPLIGNLYRGVRKNVEDNLDDPDFTVDSLLFIAKHESLQFL